MEKKITQQFTKFTVTMLLAILLGTYLMPALTYAVSEMEQNVKTSQASIEISTKNLSTVIENKNVILTATLKTNGQNTELYKDPKIKITLPEEVKNINLKDAKLIYEDELKPTRFETKENVIELDLSGEQTKHSTQVTAEGTVLRIVADLTLDNLAPTREAAVILTYTNSATNETKEISKEIAIIGPSEFITTNEIEIDGNKVIAQENEKTLQIPAKAEKKEAKISGTIVNNLGTDSKGVVILGKIPTQTDENKNFNATLETAINIEGADADIYYSSNANENIEGSAWTEQMTEDSKAYKIVLKENLTDKASLNFNYKANIPNDIAYDTTAEATYAVYYNNNAQQGNNQNIVMAKEIKMETEEEPAIKIEGTLKDLGTEKELEGTSEVKEGTYITYNVKVTNNMKESASNVKVITTLPDGIGILTPKITDGDIQEYEIDTETNKLMMNIKQIESGKSQEFKYNLAVTALYSEEEKNTRTITSTMTSTENESEVIIKKQIKVIKGDISGLTLKEKGQTELRENDEFQYSLKINNVNNEDKKNIEAKIVLPEEFEIVSVTKSYKYDETSRTIIYKNKQLKANETDQINIKLRVKKVNENKNVKITASIKCDGMENEKMSPSMEYTLKAKAFEVTYTSNIDNGSLSDKDRLEYYIDIKNNTENVYQIRIKDMIPQELAVKGYKISNSQDEKSINTNARSLLIDEKVGANETVRISIITKPYTLKYGEKRDIENKPEINIEANKVSVNSIKHTIIGTSDYTAGEQDDVNPSDDNNDQDEETEKGTYIIRGQVWLDKNANGKKDKTEKGISGYKTVLYNKETGKIALDINNKELISNTDEFGRYSFRNVLPGNYIAIIEFDNKTYEITTYKAQDLLESEDSDFIDGKQDGKDVAASNTISVIDSNIYNIDLGLVTKERFDLRLDKTINRITVTNTQDKIKTRIYDFKDKEIAKVELPNTNIDTATVTIEYILKITNEGHIPGYAKMIVDYIPEGMSFNSELNTTWYIGNDGNAYNASLSNTIINPGETKEIRLVLTKKMKDSNLGTVKNTAEIASYYNDMGLEDTDEDEVSSVEAVLGTATGKIVIMTLSITLIILSCIAIAIYVIRKQLTKII